MTKTFFISDTHFGHYKAACIFQREDGTPLRGFNSVEEMDQLMIQNWNNVINPEDRVYHVGDFCMNRKSLQIFHRLNGRIALISGNHDIWKLKEYEQFGNIDYIYGAKQFPDLGWIVTHIPVHERQFAGRWTHNLHGHLHANRVLDKFNKPDPRYFNLSVEQLNYTPIELEQLKEQLNEYD